jgi:hypothetical protein
MFKKMFVKIKEIGKKVINKVKSVIEKITEWLNRHPKVVKVVGATLSVVMTIGVFLCGGIIGMKVGVDAVKTSDDYRDMKEFRDTFPEVHDCETAINITSPKVATQKDIGDGSVMFNFIDSDRDPFWVYDALDAGSCSLNDLGSYGEKLANTFGVKPESTIDGIVTMGFMS